MSLAIPPRVVLPTCLLSPNNTQAEFSTPPRTSVSLSIIKSLPRFHQRQHHRCDPTQVAVSRPPPSSLSFSLHPSASLAHTHACSHPPPYSQFQGSHLFLKPPPLLWDYKTQHARACGEATAAGIGGATIRREGEICCSRTTVQHTLCSLGVWVCV